MNSFWAYWQIDFTSAALLLLLLCFGIATKAVRNACFWSAFVIAAICLFSPLHLLSSHYLFSAHMTVHVLLLLVIGPLLVLSLPQKESKLSSFFSFLKQHPVAGWLTGLGAMWFWHVPLVFNAAMAEAHQSHFSIIALLETASLVLAGVLFAAPVLHPDKTYRIDALSGVVYLFTACIGCSLLGLLITFAPGGTYHHFLSRHDGVGLNQIILGAGLTQAIDQQAAGLIMWVPCCLLYVTGALYLLVQWFGQKEATPLKQI